MISSAQQRFNDLSLQEQEDHFFGVARRALARWGYDGDACTLKLLNLTENATFRIDTAGDHAGMPSRFVMRVHRLDYAQRESIQVELEWLAELKHHTGLHLASPIPGLDGAYVQSVKVPDLDTSRNVVCFSFVPGKAPRDSADDTESLGGLLERLTKIPDALTIPLTRIAALLYDRFGSHGRLNIAPTLTSVDNPQSDMHALDTRDAALYRSIGRIAATLRKDSTIWTEQHLTEINKRIEWDWDATFSKDWNNYYGCHYWDTNSTLSRHDIEAIDRCRDIMHRRLKAYGRSPDRYGLIHSDLRPANLLKNNDGMTVLDFDDCGLGWYMTDIAGIVGFIEHRPDLPMVLNEIVRGYNEVWPLAEQEIREIPTFIMIRRIGLFESLLYHLNNAAPGSNEAATLTPELMAFVGKGTAVLARKYVKHYSRLPLPAGPDMVGKGITHSTPHIRTSRGPTVNSTQTDSTTTQIKETA